MMDRPLWKVGDLVRIKHKLGIMKTKYKKFLYWNILVIFINGITIYRYSGDISLSIELATVLMLSVGALYYFFEKFWKTYKQSIKEE